MEDSVILDGEYTLKYFPSSLMDKYWKVPSSLMGNIGKFRHPQPHASIQCSLDISQ